MDEIARAFEESEVIRFLEAWFAIRQFIQAANFNHFQKAGLSATQFMILNLLPVTGNGLTMGELAKRMNLKPATIAKTVDSLEERRLIKRTKSDADGRLVLVKITKQGNKFQNAAAGQFRKHIQEVFQKIATSDRRALITGLESLVRASRLPDGSVDAAPTRDGDAALVEERSSRKSRRP